MQVEIGHIGEYPLFRLAGELDHAAAPGVYDELDEHLPDTLEGGVFLDITAVPYIDSAGLSILSKLLSRCTPGAWVAIIGPTRGVFRLFEISGITTRQSLVVLKDNEEAEAYIRDLERPRQKRGRARRLSLVEGEWDEDEDEGADGDEDGPLWGDDEPSPPSGTSRGLDW